MTQVEQLNDGQEKHLEQATLAIPLEAITADLIDELAEMCQTHPGNCKLMIQVRDEQ